MRKYEEYKETLESFNEDVKSLNKLMEEQKEAEEQSLSKLPDEEKYKELIEKLFIGLMKLSKIDKQLNATTLMLVGHEISKVFGYSTRMSEDDQLKEAKAIKERLIKLLWDSPSEERSESIQEALRSIKSGFHIDAMNM